MTKRLYIRKCVIVFLSVCIMGLGLCIMRISCMGTDPFGGMNYSISELFGIPLGAVVAGVCVLCMIVTFFTRCEFINFGMFANMFLLGTSADIWKKLFVTVLGHDITAFQGMEHFVLRFIMVCAGILTMVSFNSMCISANVGIGAYDGLGYIIEDLTHGKITFKWARILCDAVCLVITFAFASVRGTQWQIIGIGTVIMALFTGPLITWIREHVTNPFIVWVSREK